ncbi:Cytochrome P450 monooxygenase [Penicillium ucsense]|uniref:Cytochrome P450 monooxygenase n=1 Tax=Penicillium ucsense TaxID=2839758 RepID=A0A8J8VXN2_9EURO|nr:Cytochrome P450 monooxygenase [Penicillium ucsense]KAF7732983.1 Cytochrome P450 monooxygenase [Penicillium ucsense]
MFVDNIQATVLACLALYVTHFIYRRVTGPLAQIPGPEISKWTEAVYVYYWLRGEIPFYVHRLHEQYGPIVRTSPGQVDICNVEAVKDIHKINSRFLKSEWYRKLVAGGHETMFSTLDRQFHAERRRLLAMPISESSLSKMEPIVLARVQTAIDRMEEEMRLGGVADVFKWWLFMATDIIGELSFGESFRMLEAKEKTQYSIDLENLSRVQAIRIAFPFLVSIGKYVPFPAFKAAGEAAKRIGQYSHQSIERYKLILAENPENPKPTLFTKMFEEKSGLSHEQIRHEAQAYIIAGSDTTAVTLTYLIYSVCRNERIRKKLLEEVSLLSEPLTSQKLRDLPYLNQVIEETLRLHPAVSMALPRTVPPEGYTFDGYFIPGGTGIGTQAYSVHRDPTIFPDPLEFKPERWQSPSREMKDASLAFGGGSRVCIGIHLAHMEMRLGTALFFRKFPSAQVSAREGMSENDMDMEAFFLMAPRGHRCLIEA